MVLPKSEVRTADAADGIPLACGSNNRASAGMPNRNDHDLSLPHHLGDVMAFESKTTPPNRQNHRRCRRAQHSSLIL